MVPFAAVVGRRTPTPPLRFRRTTYNFYVTFDAQPNGIWEGLFYRWSSYNFYVVEIGTIPVACVWESARPPAVCGSRKATSSVTLHRSRVSPGHAAALRRTTRSTTRATLLDPPPGFRRFRYFFVPPHGRPIPSFDKNHKDSLC
jgi:hypothetical protein